jgi:nucleoside-diphosphate-sugar epimerase
MLPVGVRNEGGLALARRILIAGATGEIGRRLTPALAQSGDEVYGLARTDERAGMARELGATPIRCDALDRDQVMAAVAESQPEIIVIQLTAIPRTGINPRKFTETFGPTNRLRREATRHLVDAAREHGVRRVVAQSIAFAYRAAGPDVLEESAPLDTGAEGGWGEIVRAVAALEEAVLGDGGSSGFEGVVLRYGQFYGPGTAYAPDGAIGSLVVKRRLPVIGGGGGRQPFIHMEDATSATVAALPLGAPTGVFNVTDDDPAPSREWIPGLAEALGAPKPRRVPVWLARLAAGPDAVRSMTAQRGASNARFRSEFGWRPAYPDWRAGFATLLGETGTEQ